MAIKDTIQSYGLGSRPVNVIIKTPFLDYFSASGHLLCRPPLPLGRLAECPSDQSEVGTGCKTRDCEVLEVSCFSQERLNSPIQ